jgi:hypothetical protein
MARREKKMRESLKKMLITGAVVTVMMSFAAPAMAEDLYYSPYSSTYDTTEEGTDGNMFIDRLQYFIDGWF